MPIKSSRRHQRLQASATEQALLELNETLEQRVAERTQELAQANVRLEAMSRTDGLLQIANRAYFEERLVQACAQAGRSGRPVGPGFP